MEEVKGKIGRLDEAMSGQIEEIEKKAWV